MDLARAFQVPKHSMSHTLAGLEKRKLNPYGNLNPDDGRVNIGALTDSGQAVRNRAIQD